MSPQTPTVGRIVLVLDEEMQREIPAVITRVWGDDCVNVHVLPDTGTSYVKTSMVYSDNSHGSSWRWPPRV